MGRQRNTTIAGGKRLLNFLVIKHLGVCNILSFTWRRVLVALRESWCKSMWSLFNIIVIFLIIILVTILFNMIWSVLLHWLLLVSRQRCQRCIRYRLCLNLIRRYFDFLKSFRLLHRDLVRNLSLVGCLLLFHVVFLIVVVKIIIIVFPLGLAWNFKFLFLQADTLEVVTIVKVYDASLELFQHQVRLIFLVNAQEKAKVRVNIRTLNNFTFMQQFKPLLSDEYFYLGITRLGFDNLLLEQIFHEVTETNLF